MAHKLVISFKAKKKKIEKERNVVRIRLQFVDKRNVLQSSSNYKNRKIVFNRHTKLIKHSPLSLSCSQMKYHYSAFLGQAPAKQTI